MKQLPLQIIAIDTIEQEGCGLAPFRTSLGDLNRLKASIATIGLIAPPTVWRTTEGKRQRHILVDGNRRVAAIMALRSEWAQRGAFPLDKIVVTVFEGSLQEARKLSILAHMPKALCVPHTRGDEVRAVMLLREQGMTQTDIAQLLGQAQGWVSRCEVHAEQLAPAAMDALRRGDLNRTGADKLFRMLTTDDKPDRERQAEAMVSPTWVLSVLRDSMEAELSAADIWESQGVEVRASQPMILKFLRDLEVQGAVVRGKRREGAILWRLRARAPAP